MTTHETTLAARNEREAASDRIAAEATRRGIDLGNPPDSICVGGCNDCLPVTTYLVDAFAADHDGGGPALTVHGFATSVEAVEFAASVVFGTKAADWQHGSIVSGRQVYVSADSGVAPFSHYEVLALVDGIHSDPLVRGTFRLDAPVPA